MRPAVIHLHPDAPAKPAVGAACNGCGLCCAWQPCPLGVLASRRLRGRCAALRWDGAQRLYRCGLLQPAAAGRPAPWRWLRTAFVRLTRRWIAAGAGCDCSAEAAPAGPAAG